MDLEALTRAYQSLPAPEQEHFAVMVRSHQIFTSPMLRRELARRHVEIDEGQGPKSEAVREVLSEWCVDGEVQQWLGNGVIKFCSAALDELHSLAQQSPRDAELLIGAVASFAARVSTNEVPCAGADLVSVTDESGRTNDVVLIRWAICVCWTDKTLQKVRVLSFRRALE